MNYVWLSALLSLTVSLYGQQPPNKNVLFIGNSLTYYNDMPAYLQAMLKQTNQATIIETSTYPGMTLASHLNQIIESRTENGINTRLKRTGEQTETEKKILSKKWDVVVLQEATVRVLIPEFRRLATQEAIERIKKLVNNPACTFILFKTWITTSTFPVQYCYPSHTLGKITDQEKYCSIKFTTRPELINALSADYDSVALATRIGKIDIGDKLVEILSKHPAVELYDTDSHPTKFGAYLNAYLFYKFLSGTKSSSINYYGDLTEKEAKFLQQIAN